MRQSAYPKTDGEQCAQSTVLGGRVRAGGKCEWEPHRPDVDPSCMYVGAWRTQACHSFGAWLGEPCRRSAGASLASIALGTATLVCRCSSARAESCTRV